MMLVCWPLLTLEFTRASAADLAGVVGPDRKRGLIFDASSINPYGMLGQWLLYPANTSELDNKSVAVYDSKARTRPKFVRRTCLEERQYWESVRPFITNSFRSVTFQKRRCGKRKLKCGRIVIDDALDADMLQDVYELKKNLRVWEGLDVIKDLLERYFSTGPLVVVGGQLDQNIRADLPCEMHSDFLSRPPEYFLAAIVYLVEQGKDCSQCETVFNDAIQDGRLLQGSVVQPRRGRLVLFSGGVENLHCKVPSLGKRDVLQFWFKCESEVAKGMPVEL